MQSIKIICRPFTYENNHQPHPNSTHVFWMGYNPTKELFSKYQTELRQTFGELRILEISLALAVCFIQTRADLYADDYDQPLRASISRERFKHWTEELKNDGFTEFKH